MLELSHVFCQYAGREVLRDVTLSFPPGQVLGLVGPNGSGKSTLLKTALGIQPKSGGTITLDGVPLEQLRPKEIARQVSYLPQFRSVPDITTWRLVLHGRFPHLGYPRRYRQADYDAVTRALEAAGALPLADRFLGTLSGGQRKKVYLAMALAQESGTVLMDEPTTYLDIAHQFQVTDLARQLAEQGKAVVLVLHDLPLAFRTADQVAVLREGELAALGQPEELYDSPVISETFGVSLHRLETASGWQYFCEPG